MTSKTRSTPPTSSSVVVEVDELPRAEAERRLTAEWRADSLMS